MRPILRRILTSRRTAIALAIVVAVPLVWAAIQRNDGCDWTGFGACTPTGGELRPEKTLWDWLDLLIVPAVLAVVGLVFTRQERANERAIAEQRTVDERAIAEQRFQDDTLRTYLDQMTELLLHESLRATPPNPEARDVARVRTLIALRRLDAERRAIVMHFLRDSKLVGLKDDEKIVNFDKADLRQADLAATDLSRISLAGADLSGADLTAAKLFGADLSGADLSQAHLSMADLSAADLSMADLTEAKLFGANLFGADLTEAKLSGADLFRVTVLDTQLESAASLSGATLPDGKMYDSETNRPPNTSPPSSQDS